MKRKTRSQSISVNEEVIIKLLKEKFIFALIGNPECDVINLSVYDNDIALKIFTIIKNYFNKNFIKLENTKLNIKECALLISSSDIEKFTGLDKLINRNFIKNHNRQNINTLYVLLTEDEIINHKSFTQASELEKEKNILLNEQNELKTTLVKELRELIMQSTINIMIIEKLLLEQSENRIYITELTSALVNMKVERVKLQECIEHFFPLSLPSNDAVSTSELPALCTVYKQPEDNDEEVDIETTGEPLDKKRKFNKEEVAAEALISLSSTKKSFILQIKEDYAGNSSRHKKFKPDNTDTKFAERILYNKNSNTCGK
ncbi:hypothetical protein NF27_DP00120 [Candidatus Jidaibacter acanthamoeba]|uniref:Uncharacterized protein n=1 Tax=Candidatus Jidaibacter acanthamoebae TaxID=86105 RepID=A0A0C1QN79_9RICK|nr:hypothetical protein [Candidatus Jidaibacter acanthamoeba]KIE05468.1 hypothetical protein NF27_DP00120 [Candidatus Jidaibacter acanthamoeba]